MSLSRQATIWAQRFDRRWAEFSTGLFPLLLERGFTARHKIAYLVSDLQPFSFVEPARVAALVLPMAPIVEAAVAEEDAEVGEDDSVSFANYDTLDLANLIECVGGKVSPATLDIFRRWLPRMRVSRDDDDTSDYWSTGYASLALDVPKYNSFIVGRRDGKLPRPDPTARHGFNLQALLGQLAAAVEQRAPFLLVVEAWEDFLRHFPHACLVRSVSDATLLWIARVVYHRIAGHPLGTVVQHLHDDIWRLARLT